MYSRVGESVIVCLVPPLFPLYIRGAGTRQGHLPATQGRGLCIIDLEAVSTLSASAPVIPCLGVVTQCGTMGTWCVLTLIWDP